MAVAGLAQVDIGVLALGTPMPIVPICSFTVHDSEIAWVETLSGEQRLDDPAEVAVYVAAFDKLFDAAATGDDAAALIRRAAATAGVQPGSHPDRG